ncbi:endonuclease/exonuclease/phosphatase family protein [Helcococcus ovis]|uniref:Endonuclease/exonuclease/phosphatase family protein n=3 Tax=Helcococcus ovis TaxID=72026 RepID=A0A4R9C159_9FIRM|nr:endonuclease/exonuclease/phosphatase family protein [Helcococcus ovis]TFF64082.1 endonuclease/exonuclease/phosphatase family protein [Helcococcus ovis]TFF64985.1 endonuclease/exonuclease/phosphatase family protein [Helcococcus ovis]TFF67906.1 endonuclease/exonuclease/phosphatase family protein [Helcococcus ovis]WNZ01594.1 endonuclease/exonuclease/phosphatase family protein [Helcococcus ovis]
MKKYKIMSFNLRYENEFDKYSWNIRKNSVKKVIEKYSPDFIGFQEVKENQLKDLKILLENKYDFYGVFRDETDGKEMNPIFVKNNKFNLRHTNTFWLSKNITEKFNIGWDGDLARICSFGIVSDKSTNENLFVFMNTHFDHVGINARIKSSDLIINSSKLLSLAFNIPVIITGDFNTRPIDGYIDKLLNHKDFDNSFNHFKNKENTLTIHNYSDEVEGQPIDYVFTQNPIKILSSEIIRDKFDDIFTSDHYQVLVKIEI